MKSRASLIKTLIVIVFCGGSGVLTGHFVGSILDHPWLIAPLLVAVLISSILQTLVDDHYRGRHD